MDQICHAFTLHTLTVFYIKTINLATVINQVFTKKPGYYNEDVGGRAGGRQILVFLR